MLNFEPESHCLTNVEMKVCLFLFSERLYKRWTCSYLKCKPLLHKMNRNVLCISATSLFFFTPSHNEFLRHSEAECVMRDSFGVWVIGIKITWSEEQGMDNKQGSVYKNKINFEVETQVTEYISGATGAGNELLLASELRNRTTRRACRSKMKWPCLPNRLNI